MKNYMNKQCVIIKKEEKYIVTLSSLTGKLNPYAQAQMTIFQDGWHGY